MGDITDKTKYIHLVPKKGYKIVTILAQYVSPKNGLTPIEEEGEIFYTGGILIKYDERIIRVLNTFPDEDQYDFIYAIKNDTLQHHIKMYLDNKEI